MKRTNEEKIKLIAYAALFTALAYVSFLYFKIDIYVGAGKTSFHIANAFVVLAALFIGGFWGGIAGAVGLTIGDLFDPKYVMAAPATFILKLLIGLIAGAIAHRIFHISRPHDKKKIFAASVAASVPALLFNCFADPIGRYFYNSYILGQEASLASALAKMSAVTTFVNALISVFVSVILYNALRPILEKSGLFFRLERNDEEDTNNSKESKKNLKHDKAAVNMQN